MHKDLTPDNIMIGKDFHLKIVRLFWISAINLHRLILVLQSKSYLNLKFPALGFYLTWTFKDRKKSNCFIKLQKRSLMDFHFFHLTYGSLESLFFKCTWARDRLRASKLIAFSRKFSVWITAGLKMQTFLMKVKIS